MVPASVGDKVRVHYRLLLGDKTDFYSSYGKEPLEFTLGRGMMFSPGLQLRWTPECMI
jgi:FKBP-type peptidyl-prolyl cis-trans isomerase